MRIAFVGTGSMGSALLEGVQASTDAQIVATCASAASATRLHERLGIDTLAVETTSDANLQAIRGAQFVFVGVKPWMLAQTLKEIAPYLEPQAVVISMAAGFSLADMAKHVPNNPVVRIMPNTPSQVGRGVIALSAGQGVSDEQVQTLTELLTGAGLVFPLEEEQIGAMTAISGSGVAYFFLLAESLAKTGVELGLDEETANRMVAQTALGAGLLLDRTPEPADLRKAVTSKGGTTHAAIETFRAHNLDDIVFRAGTAAVERGKEMERENAE